VAQNAKLVTRLSFEGRHIVEEGIEFEASIEVINYSPCFEVSSEYHHDDCESLYAICRVLQHDLERELRRIAQRHRSGITFTAADIRVLGKQFIRAMLL